MDEFDRLIALLVLIFLQRWVERRIQQGRMFIQFLERRRRLRQAMWRNRIAPGSVASEAVMIPRTTVDGRYGLLANSRRLVRRPILRRIWVQPRPQLWWDTFTDCDDDIQWRRHFRMSQASFMFLVDKLSPYMLRQDTNFRQAIAVRKRVAVALWRLATGCDFRNIQELFGLSQSSACLIVQEFITAVSVRLKAQYLHRPSPAEIEDIVNRFRDTWGYPQCVGAIDCTHVPVIAPSEHRNDYYNRKGWYSVICQAVVDSRYMFWDIDVGWPGKVHDARVLSNSTIYALAQRDMLFPMTTQQFGGVEVPLCLIGDAAYPLNTWLMKPYREAADTTEAQRYFNYRLSRARMTVECAFGRLKGRWRAIMKRNDHHISLVPTMVLCCAILHNICERRGEVYDQLEDAENEMIQPHHPPPATQVRGEAMVQAQAIRDGLCDYFSGLNP